MSEAPLIDWDLAIRIGTKLVPPGPHLDDADRTQLVAELRDCARRAPELVADAAAMPEHGEAAELVIDRAGAVAATLGSGRAMIERVGLVETGRSGLDKLRGQLSAVAVGPVAAVLATRVLGQFDPFVAEPRLVLVAPNIARVERELRLVPADFRMWVCLHEQTHRVQFAHAPWLVEHLVGLTAEVLDAEEDGFDLSGLFGTKPADDRKAPSLRVLSRVTSQRTTDSLDRVTAVMSLLEGHADVMMDRAGPAVIKTLPRIRRAFDARRGRGGWSALLGRLLGLDAKLAQYADGAKFCRQVIDRAGVEALNLAFRDAASLPSWDELHDPAAWLARQGV